MDSLEAKTEPVVSAFYFQRKVAFYSGETADFVNLFQLTFENLSALKIDLKDRIEGDGK